MKITTHYKSANFTEVAEEREIKFIILHYTEMNFDDAMQKLCDENAVVSSHYLIHKNGDIYNLVDEKNIAWHAGESHWRSFEKLNDHSIGIEIDNLGIEKFSDAQMQSCIDLCKNLRIKYELDAADIIAHSDIAPNRKWDPGIFFDWDLLLQNDIGITYKKPYLDQKNNIIFSKGDSDSLPEPRIKSKMTISSLQQRLKNIGYNIEITGIFDNQTNLVIRAFQAHFCQKSIWDRGGVKYFRDVDSIFPWDEWSEFVLNHMLSYKKLE